MLETVLLLLTVAVAVVLIYAAMQPDTFSVARTTRINAPPDKIFALIDEPRAMNTWNPFVKDDPKTQLTYTGPARGVGAGNDFGGGSSGNGRVLVTESSPPNKVVMQLDMTSPFETHNRVEFCLVPSGAGTDVTWSMTGRMNYLHKLMHTAIGARMVKSSFDRGLADLKTMAEK